MAASDESDVKNRLAERQAASGRPANRGDVMAAEDAPADGNLLYVVQGDGPVTEGLAQDLEQAGYCVQQFTEMAAVEVAFEKQLPVAIIIDEVFKVGVPARVEPLARLKAKQMAFPPVICLSLGDDIEIRLAAARAGVQRYFRKPIDTQKLIQSLNGLTTRTARIPYRVLLIDDDESLLECYAAGLRDAGMEVYALSRPLEALEVLARAKPDVVVLDVDMPDCSGPELAQVIRQDDAHAMLPILFLSLETQVSQQQAVLGLGGEDFLVKPIPLPHLLEATTVRAKRARWKNRIYNELESALRENRFQLTTMDEHDIVSATDIRGNITGVNDRFCRISGYRREELLGQNHRILKSGLHSDEFYQQLWATIASGKVWRGTICNLNKNGEEYWVESTIVPFLDERGRPYKYVSARTDVTAVRQSEERLKRSQTFANIGTWDWNIKTGALYWSDRIGPLFGYKEIVPETSYENFVSFLHPDDRQSVLDAVENCIEHGIEYNIEHRVVWPDGSMHWLSEQGNVARSADGEPLHMLGVVQDIDHRKQAELALRESRQRLSEAQALARIGNWQADLRTGELSWSEEIYRIFGYEPGSFEPSVAAFHGAVHPDDRARVRESERQAEKTGRHDVVHRIVRPDGVVRYVHELGDSELDGQGTLIRLTGTVQDVTEREEAEQKLLALKEEAENANRAKSQFLSSMSHELRTPMNAIMGFSQLLKMETDPPLTESQEENVDEIVKAGSHLLELINEVLDLARIEAGRIDLFMETVALGEVIAESLQLIKPLADRRGIEIYITREGEEIPPEKIWRQHIAVRSDRTRLKQVLLNLLSNAVKYNREQGRLTIACEQIGNGSGEPRIRISVVDTGEGISLEQQSKLFTAFNRLGKDQQNVEGTGIGLVITKNIVERMRGQIGMQSRPGEGSTFWVELPGDKLLPAQKALIDGAENITSPVVLDGSHKYTVLYVEDNPANLRLVGQVFANLSHIHMWSAHEPMLGLELAAEHRPDLILLDINLPGMDGFEVLRHLRQREETSGTPVIAVSANAMDRDIEKGMAAGFDEYITKPINVEALIRMVNSRLSCARTE